MVCLKAPITQPSWLDCGSSTSFALISLCHKVQFAISCGDTKPKLTVYSVSGVV